MPHWLVIDLEATTAEGGWPLEEMEIIEIGATLVAAADARELDHFQRFVRPVRRPLLTHFCRDLTHISQANVDGAAHLDTVWASAMAPRGIRKAMRGASLAQREAPQTR